MVDLSKSVQGQGYDFYDYDVLVFPAAGAPFIEAVYVVGTNQNAALQGAWPNESGWVGPLLTVNALAGAFAITVASAVGFVVGQIVRIEDTAGSETNFIAAIVGNVITMAAPLANNYTVANAATLYPYLPVDAQNTLFFASVAVNIRLINRALPSQQAFGVLPAGVPGQITVPATTWWALPDKWFIIQAIAVGALPGTLIIKASG